MRKNKLFRVFAYCVLGVWLMIINGCQKQNTSPATPTCSVTGTTINTGTLTGGNYVTYFANVNGYNYYLNFNNTNTNMEVYRAINGVVTGNSYIMDIGPRSCLDFSYSGTPAASQVAYRTGEAYVGLFSDGHIVKFLALQYNSGIAMITYIFQ